MKKFIRKNESFVCLKCGTLVEKHKTSSRDHCNHCLYGLHVDINPGDRANQCKGILKPIGIKISNKKIKIAYNCLKCREKVLCIKAEDDNIEILEKLSKMTWRN